MCCAAGLARPAAVAVAEQMIKPTNKITVFAGQDKEATQTMRVHSTSSIKSILRFI